MEWSFNASHAQMNRFVFSGKSAPRDQLTRINIWLQEIGDDVLILAECGNEGAIVSLIQANLAGTGNAKQIKFIWANGEAKLFAKYRF